MKDKLNLYKVVNKKTGVMSDFIDYELLKCIPNVKKDYEIYCLVMDNVTDYIEV